MSEFDTFLGTDAARRDRAYNGVAVAVFGLTGLAILFGGGAWYWLRPAQAGMSPIIELSAPAVSSVPLDTPVLRRGDSDDTDIAGPSVTIIDGATGEHQTIVFGPDLDGADGTPDTVAR
ncbi:hypothetical protein MWN34_13200 [Ancylobacter sp. 6x-1]|uniref:SPOR domain-containing protein n=1 Tax=Ancylobacter crimeensis TaxID=2579147 RepID=A0ABT0DD26_9HYPH|nr:hypothetical protein [Ancylobacter crimeensis]MCK0197865.1 hypothetical protein [Ancylobacter crimeensis]